MITTVRLFVTQRNIKEVLSGPYSIKLYNIDEGKTEMLSFYELLHRDDILDSFVHDYDSGWIAYYKDSKSIHIDNLKHGPSKYLKS